MQGLSIQVVLAFAITLAIAITAIAGAVFRAQRAHAVDDSPMRRRFRALIVAIIPIALVLVATLVVLMFVI